MRKAAIGSLVGGLILFFWQTLSNTALNLHGSSIKYTPQQDSIMNYLNNQFTEDGRFFMPRLPEGASADDNFKLEKSAAGKPWAIISYHKSYEFNMVMNIVRTFFTDIIIVWLLCWILLKIPNRTMQTVFLVTLITGFIAFLNGLYTQFIWYPEPGIYMHFIDAVVSWGLCGLWLGWWLKRRV